MVRLFEPTPYAAYPLVPLPWLPPVIWAASAVATLMITARLVSRCSIPGTPDSAALIEFAAALAALMLCFPVLEANTYIIGGLAVGALALTVAAHLQNADWRRMGGLITVLWIVTNVNGTIAWSYSHLGALRDLHGGSLVVAALTSVPYLYLAALTLALVGVALRIELKSACSPAPSLGMSMARTDAAADEVRGVSAQQEMRLPSG
jgi:hypothetical protein